MSGKTYKPGDRVFAKVKGFPHWPARIDASSPTGKPTPKGKYPVFFYGTHEHCFLSTKELYDYDSNKDQYAVNRKHGGFKEGLGEVENNRWIKYKSSENITLPETPNKFEDDDTIVIERSKKSVKLAPIFSFNNKKKKKKEDGDRKKSSKHNSVHVEKNKSPVKKGVEIVDLAENDGEKAEENNNSLTEIIESDNNEKQERKKKKKKEKRAKKASNKPNIAGRGGGGSNMEKTVMSELEMIRNKNIADNKNILAKLMADLKAMGPIPTALKPAPAVPKPRKEKPVVRRPVEPAFIRRNPSRTTRGRSRKYDSDDTVTSCSEQEDGHFYLKFGGKRSHDEATEDSDSETEEYGTKSFPKRRKVVPDAVPREIRSVDEITQQDLDMVATASTGKVYDATYGTTCHQCRQKTLDMKTVCRSDQCFGVRGQFCGPCLRNRYGEDTKAALVDPHWACPPCRGFCNCSICRRNSGKNCTGILIHLAKENGYDNVKDYLFSLSKEEPVIKEECESETDSSSDSDSDDDDNNGNQGDIDKTNNGDNPDKDSNAIGTILIEPMNIKVEKDDSFKEVEKSAICEEGAGVSCDDIVGKEEILDEDETVDTKNAGDTKDAVGGMAKESEGGDENQSSEVTESTEKRITCAEDAVKKTETAKEQEDIRENKKTSIKDASELEVQVSEVISENQGELAAINKDIMLDTNEAAKGDSAVSKVANESESEMQDASESREFANMSETRTDSYVNDESVSNEASEKCKSNVKNAIEDLVLNTKYPIENQVSDMKVLSEINMSNVSNMCENQRVEAFGSDMRNCDIVVVEGDTSVEMEVVI